jgi:NADH:ubiquinone oxidoreductase subunit B-like Fe-S oxidoreductase
MPGDSKTIGRKSESCLTHLSHQMLNPSEIVSMEGKCECEGAPFTFSIALSTNNPTVYIHN